MEAGYLRVSAAVDKTPSPEAMCNEKGIFHLAACTPSSRESPQGKHLEKGTEAEVTEDAAAY